MPGGPKAPPRPILIVEDQTDVREAIVELLHVHGYRTLEAENGRAALEALHSGERPCLILLDLAMPVMDGRAFREALQRDRPDLADVPVVISSAFTHDPKLMDRISAAAAMPKPIDPDHLVAIVQRFCERDAA